MGLMRGDPREIEQAGWAVICAQADENINAVLAALDPLLTLRKNQIGQEFKHRYQEYVGDFGYQSGDTKRRFLSRHGVGPGAADPDRMPYYLLIVGDPEIIPWEFQHDLDIQYAVGRIWFETLEEYQRYARNVAAAEAPRPVRAKRAVVFAPQHAGDPSTELSLQHLATPLAERIEKTAKGWTVNRAFGEDATKANLVEMLSGGSPPALLFTAGHGLWLPKDHPSQLSKMGALICQDWQSRGPALSGHYFCADDMNGADLGGLISFHFSCFSAGVPLVDGFSIEPRQIAPHAFVSLLPRRLLQSGALAVIGHVDTAWQCSIEFPGAGRHIEVFEDFVDRLLNGDPVGLAMEQFGVRYADLARDLSAELEELQNGKSADDGFIAELWRQSRDARDYVVLGDPAVRLIACADEPPDRWRQT